MALLAEVYADQGQYKKSGELYEDSILTSRSINDDFVLAAHLSNAGKMYSKAGEYKEAYMHLEEAYGIVGGLRK